MGQRDQYYYVDRLFTKSKHIYVKMYIKHNYLQRTYNLTNILRNISKNYLEERKNMKLYMK